MGFLEKIQDFFSDGTQKEDITLQGLKDAPYKQKYFDECKFIWKNYVPKKGSSDVLQGELLREIEKLRCEAQDNGNINWDEDFSYFCDFIKDTLCSMNIYSESEKEKYTLITDYLKNCGEYLKQWDGRSEESLLTGMMIYTEDNLYDILADAVGYLQSVKNVPIAYEVNHSLKR